MMSMEWSHTHFDGYELLAAPSVSPSSIVILDSSALVLVQKILLPAGDSPPRSLTWQPGGARTGSSSGALSCIVSSGGSVELAIFTPTGVHLSSRVRYSWSCATRVPLSPLHTAPSGRLLLAWSCRGPLVVADQAISVWSNCSLPADATAMIFSDDESTGEDDAPHHPRGHLAAGPRGTRTRTIAYRNSLRLSRKWVHTGAGKTRFGPAPQFVAIATSPCGHMIATAYTDKDEIMVWMRRSNVPPRGGKPWEMRASLSGEGREKRSSGEGSWNFQPATVLPHSGPLVQLVWGRDPGSQQDYLLTLGEDGSAQVWIEHQSHDHLAPPMERGSTNFMRTATIRSWYGESLRLKSVGFVKWAYFGSHGRDLVRHDGTAPGSAYHLLHQQEQEADGGSRTYRNDSWVVGCGEDGRRFVWSLKGMPLPDGRTIPDPVEVASLPFSWLVGLSATEVDASALSAALPQVSAIGYYDTHSVDGAPTELQVSARAAGGTIAVITARVHRSDPNSRFVFRNTRSVVLPIGQAVAQASFTPRRHGGDAKVVVHPNLPLVARLGGKSQRGVRGGARAVEVHSWVNGGSHLQCIPCKPRGKENGQPGHTVGAEPEGAGDGGDSGDGGCLIVSPASSSTTGSPNTITVDVAAPGGAVGEMKDVVAPVFSELAQKVRSGDELSFVPYALPSLTLGSYSGQGEGGVDGGKNKFGNAQTPLPSSSSEEDIKHAMWLADWIGTEALPPALAVVDSKSRLHVFELDDGASSEGPDAAAAAMSVKAAYTGPYSSSSSGDPQHLRAEWQGKWGSTSGKSAMGESGSVMSLTNSNRSLQLKGMMMEDSKEPGRFTPERISRRARGELRGVNIDEGVLPAEKTVVLPLDNKYGLGLTLAFENNRVEVATFVKHPDTNEMLPAEASGRIRPGDELVDINGHSVEGLNVEEAMALIRDARRETMERGSVSLELTFRENSQPLGSACVRPDPRSPKPRTGWYPRRSKRKSGGGVGSRKGGGEERGSAKGSSAAGWANTDAEQHALRWQSVGSSKVPALKTCTLIPWFGVGTAAFAEAGHEGATGIRGSTLDHSDDEDLFYSDDGPWAEIGVYPPGDPRRRREALLLGFQPPQASSSSKGRSSDSNAEGYVVALLVNVGAEGGVSVTEMCRTTLEEGHEPVSFNREKAPPGPPTNSRASVEAVCMDGWVRRWSVACEERNKDLVRFALSRVDICRPFRPLPGDGRDPKTETTLLTTTALIAMASPTLLAVARSTDEPTTPIRAPANSFPDVLTHSQMTAAQEAEEVAAKGKDITVKESPALLEVWSCSPTAYPRCPFKKEDVLVVPWLRAGQAVEGMCWVSPEAGDERGAAVSGHCLCVSVEGSVTVLAREKRQRPLEKLKGVASVREGLIGGGEGDDGECWTWSPVFRVANPCSLLASSTAGLRDFCQGLMAKYQRNLALSLVRSRRSRIPPALGTVGEAESDEEAADVNSDADPDSVRSSSVPLPLLRNELDGLRGGTTREGRRLEDWHPESLVAMWCTSLEAGEHGFGDGGDRGRGRWAKGRERTLSVLRWVARDSGLESGGVMAGTVAPLLVIGGGTRVPTGEFGDGKGDEADNVDGGLGKLEACLSSYMSDRLKEEEKTPDSEGQPHVSSENMFSSSASSGRRRSTKSPSRGITPASARDVADIAAAAGIPRRLLSLSGAELLALSALLEEALGQDVGLSAVRTAKSSNATGAVSGAATDTAAALFAPSRDRPITPPSPSSPPLGVGLRGSGNTKSLSPSLTLGTKDSDDFASIFLFARGLRARLCASNGRGVEALNPGIASSAALAMLLAPSSTQKEVLETLCPKAGGIGAGGGGLSWNDARALMLPMWIRNVSELQRVTEFVADSTFRQDKDIMAAAIFFAVLGKERKLLSLAKADRGFVGQRPLSGQEGDLDTNSGKAQGMSQGQRLEKLLSHDFSSQRGRAVAEKNAFILLRKRQFKAAAAVFLLARPAMLKEALQVIILHVKDLQLALTVVRLVEVRDAGGGKGMGSIGGNGIGSFGGGGAIRSFGGGGGGGIGGFGGGGIGSFGGGGDESDVEADAGAVYATIGGATKKILRDEFLPTFDGESDLPKAGRRHGDMVRSRSMTSIGTGHTATPRQRDPFMECVTLLWLGQSERALRALCRGPAAEQNAYNLDLTAPTAPARATTNSSRHGSPSAAGTLKRTESSASTVATDGVAGLIICNRAIDVATRPFLVSKLEVIHRERKPVPAQNSLGSRGGYMSSPDVSWHSAPTSGGNSSSDAGSAKAKAKCRVDNALRAAAVRLTTVEYLARNGMEISALEVLGNASGKKWAVELADLAKEKEEAAEGGTAAVGRESTGGRGNSQRGSGGVLSSSGTKGGKVFKKTVSFEQNNTGELSGDMFGGFDGPPQTKPKVSAGSASAMASGELSGDMFGGFDGPPQRKLKAAAGSMSAMASGELSGDMFGGFDGPPQRKLIEAAGSASAMASGELSGDMFGGFDGPPQREPKAATGSTSAISSGELSGDIFGGFEGPPVQKKVIPAAAASSMGNAMASGELSGDIFGSFEAPPSKREAKKPVASTANALASGELSGDLFGGFDGPRTSPKMPQQSKPRGRKSVGPDDSVASGQLSSDLFAAFDGPASSGLRVSSSLKSPTSPSAIWTPGSSRHGLASPNNNGRDRSSFGENSVKSYGYREGEEPSWEAYDSFVAEDNDQAGGVDKSSRQPSEAKADDDATVPQQFVLWAEDLAYEAATKRLLREVRHLFGGLDALAPTSSNMAFALNSLGTAAALLGHNGDKDQAALLDGVRATIVALCHAHGLSPRALTASAAGSLCHASAGGSRRLGALCLLLHALGRSVAADAVVCAAAGRLMQCCSAHGQAHLEDLSVRAAHAKALSTEAEAAKKEARETALSEAVGGGAGAVTEPRTRPAGSFITAAVAKATAERKVEEARVAEEAAAAAAGGMGLENLRPHLSELRAAAFQLELCLALHARGCLRLSSRARAEAAVGFRAGLLVEALGRRYDVTETLVGHPPAPMELDVSSVQREGEERKVLLDTPNADLLDALSRLPNPEFETLGLEPWESTLGGHSRPPSIEKRRNPPTRPRSRSRSPVPRHGSSGPVGGYGQEGWSISSDLSLAPDEERLHLARLTESLSRGVWPTYARLACALNLLSLRAIHGQLCVSLARLIWRPSYRARAPLSSRVCGAVPFHPASEGGEALDTALSAQQEPWRSGRGTAGTGRERRRRSTASSGSSSLTFYSAFLHPIYIWAQCLDRQFYSQAHRPRVAPSHHLVPRRRARAVSEKIVATAHATSDGDKNAAARAPATVAASGSAVYAPSSGVWDDSAKPPPVKTYESRLSSPGEHRRECCPYLFQRAMLVSEDGVRGGRDHLRSDETWSEEDSEERVAYQMLHGMRRSNGSVLPSVALHAVRESSGNTGDVHFVEAFYSSDARTWLLLAGVDPAGPSAGSRLRRWESLGIAQRVTKAAGGGGHIHFRGERHKGDVLLRFVDRWEAEHCDESGGGALRGGPLGRMSYQPVPVGRSTVSLDTLYGKLLYAIGERAALELWKKLAVEDWLVRTISRAEFPFSYRHQLAEFSSASCGEVTATKVKGAESSTPAAGAADVPFLLHDGSRRERDAFCLCVFEHLCRNALFRRLRLPHRFQALVTVQLLRLKNLSPNYHPSKTEVFAAVTLKRADPASSNVSSADGHGGGNGHVLGDSALKRRGRNTSVTGAKALLPTANGQATQESRWGAKAAFRFPLPEEASPYVLTHGDRAYELVMGGCGDSGSWAGMGSQGPPRYVRIVVWRKQFLSDQKLGEVEVPLGKLNDRVDVDEWVALRGDKGAYWFVNVRFTLRFVMVSVSDPIPEDEDEEDESNAPESPRMTLSHALEDVDVM